MEFLDLKQLDAGWCKYFLPRGMRIGYGVAPLTDDKKFVIFNVFDRTENLVEKTVFNTATGDFHSFETIVNEPIRTLYNTP